MLYKGGNTTPLSLEQILFLHRLLSGKPASFRDPKTLFKLLTGDRYINQFKEQGLSFENLKQYFDLINSRKLDEYKYKLDPTLKPAPLPPRPIILPPQPIPPQPIPPQQTAPPAAVIAPAPSSPGKFGKIAAFFKRKFTKKSPAPPAPQAHPAPSSPGKLKKFVAFLGKTFKKKISSASSASIITRL